MADPPDDFSLPHPFAGPPQDDPPGSRIRSSVAYRKSLGQKTVIVLPVHYPRELFTAMDVHTVELWGPPGPPCGPDAGRIPAYACALVRNALAFFASGGADDADAVLFPHTCDSIQGLATLAPDFGGLPIPAWRYLHPKGEDRPAARAFVRGELRCLSEELERLTGRPLSPSLLARSIALHGEIDRLRRTLLDRRAFLAAGDRALYRLLRRGESLWPGAHLAELRSAVRAVGAERVQRGVPLMITGYVPEPMALFDRLAANGAFTAADDYAAVGRRVPAADPPDGGEPFDVLVAKSFSMPPCPTRGADQRLRMDHLERLYRRSGAEGLIVHLPLFCEPESFDVPAILRRFDGVPTLLLETGLETDLSAQAATRLEAFVEMVKASGSPR